MSVGRKVTEIRIGAQVLAIVTETAREIRTLIEGVKDDPHSWVTLHSPHGTEAQLRSDLMCDITMLCEGYLIEQAQPSPLAIAQMAPDVFRRGN